MLRKKIWEYLAIKISLTLIFIFVSASGFVYAQNSKKVSSLDPKNKPYWWTLELGKKHFGERDYGAALIAFQDARNERREMYSRMEEDWITLLSISEVRRYRDSLDLIEKYIAERGQFDAAAALEEIYYRVGKEAIKNSAKNVLDCFGRLKDYPEADYWIGEIYRIEGDLGIAVKQYTAALSNASGLQDGTFALDIEYKLAEVEQLRQNYNAMERHFESILKQDTMWMQDQDGGSASFVRNAMSRTLSGDGFNKFLIMYRYKNNSTEKAHRLWGNYLFASGRHNPAKEHLMFAALIQNTVIIDEVISKNFDFKFTTLDNLMSEITRRNNLHSYMVETEYFRTLYLLACSSYATNDVESARGIWTFLANAKNAAEWGGRAKKQLVSPYIEKAIEMP
ncbi:hypothetical protein FACS1894102_7540 [Spirochaetia bacterium]|nr:hypothetical protein FACS1894102_7540 [Spirochaetia bacterium]